MRPISGQDAETAKKMRSQGVSIRQVAKALRIDSKTVQKILKK